MVLAGPIELSGDEQMLFVAVLFGVPLLLVILLTALARSVTGRWSTAWLAALTGVVAGVLTFLFIRRGGGVPFLVGGLAYGAVLFSAAGQRGAGPVDDRP